MKKFNERFLFQIFSSLQIFPLSFWRFFFQKIKSYISFNKTTYTLYFFKFLIEIQRIDSSIYCQKKTKKDFLFYREAKKKIRLEDQKRKCKRDKKLVSPGSSRWSSNARPRKKKKKKRDSADGKVRRRVV